MGKEMACCQIERSMWRQAGRCGPGRSAPAGIRVGSRVGGEAGGVDKLKPDFQSACRACRARCGISNCSGLRAIDESEAGREASIAGEVGGQGLW